MFSVLSEGLKYGEGPKSNMIAEPAQVVVMMPNSRVIKAETELQNLKSGLFVIMACIGLAMLFGLYYFFTKKSRVDDTLKGSPKAPIDLKKAALMEKIILGGPPQIGSQGQSSRPLVGQVGPQAGQNNTYK